jgi:AcrR family transcriptional regulator
MPPRFRRREATHRRSELRRHSPTLADRNISRGLISYHFTGKDELMKEVVREVLEQGTAYSPRPCAPAVSARLRLHPDFDIDSYTREIANVFEVATRIDE